MRTPDRYTTETGRRPASQIAKFLASRPGVEPREAHRPRRYKTNKSNPLHRK